jgi:dipeptidyl aminopeptidase/acylaminoacyl peptidase
MADKRNEPAPFGSWNSPITADAVVTEAVVLSEPRIDGENVYWIEGRPPTGRGVVVVRSSGGTISCVTPDPFDVRSQVYSYGGGAYIVHDGTVYFVHYKDNQIYKQTSRRLDSGDVNWSVPLKLTSSSKCLFADLCVDATRNRLIAIREERRNIDDAINANHALVAVDIETGNETTLDAGWDFYSSPVLSSDGSRLAWLSWRQPNMPWMSTYVLTAEFDETGGLRNKQTIAGSDSESIFQPQWSPDGILYFISDQTEFWNVYRWKDPNIEHVLRRQVEFGIPQWRLGESTYAFVSADRMIYSFTENGMWRLGRLDLPTLTATDYDPEFSSIGGVRATASTIVLRCANLASPPAIATVEANAGTISVLKYSVPRDSFEKFQRYLSKPQAVQFPTSNNDLAYGFYYRPYNPDWSAPGGEKPPLLVKSHGGPTSAADCGLDLSLQFWTSRGFAVLDVNYRGSSGFGRKYREKLYGQWGVFDVIDCISGARHLATCGEVDSNKLAITGGSAGGYTTLCGLTFHDQFKAGASYYGISDLVALVTNTHKFELHYLDWLIAPYRPAHPLYHDRSPVNFVDKLSAPIIFLHGQDDPVVPVDQAKKMYSSLLGRNVPACLMIFQGEKHGFRQSAHKRRALESEHMFYAINLLQNPVFS